MVQVSESVTDAGTSAPLPTLQPPILAFNVKLLSVEVTPTSVTSYAAQRRVLTLRCIVHRPGAPET